MQSQLDPLVDFARKLNARIAFKCEWVRVVQMVISMDISTELESGKMMFHNLVAINNSEYCSLQRRKMWK